MAGNYAILHIVKVQISLVASLMTSIALPVEAGSVRTAACAADIAHAIANMETNVHFSVEAKVTILPRKAILGIVDGTGAAALSDFHHNRFEGIVPGDCIRASGFTKVSTNSMIPTAYCEQISVLSHGKPPEPRDITASEFHSGRFDLAYVRVKGVVRDVFIDEIDPEWLFLVVGSEQGNVFASFRISEYGGFDSARLEGAEVAISGLCIKQRVDRRIGSRHALRRTLGASGLESIDILKPSPADPFLAPKLESAKELSPEEVASTGRRRITGRVLAVWGGRHLMIEPTDRKDVVQCDLKEGPPPACDTLIEAVGLPETDLFRINLTRAIWRRAPPTSAHAAETPPTDISAEDLFTDENGKSAIQTRFYGLTVRVRGVVRSLPASGDPEKRIYVECGKFTLPVDVSATLPLGADLAIGCEISVAGVCVVRTDNWSPHSPFPHIRDVFLVPRSASDIAVLRRPPWWTPQRLLVALAALLFAMLIVLIWNLLLRRLAERRGKELAEEHIARAETDMKVLERTRLAVELHDSVAQNLTAVAMELETARQFQNGARPELLSHFAIAWRTLKSCRDELRNCLWDLRSQALEEPDMETAIRRTLLPVVKGVNTAIRFKVPREILTDNTTHAILRIIRELAINGIRHGGAASIWIAGSIDGGTLQFSVRDDGCGFDAQKCPGVEDGHFGMHGIRERLRHLAGRMTVESAPGRGTKTTISISLPKGQTSQS